MRGITMSHTLHDIDIKIKDEEHRNPIGLLPSPTLRPSTWVVENQLASQFPAHFKGIHFYKPELVRPYRHFLQNLKHSDRAYLQPHDSLKYLANSLGKFIASQDQNISAFKTIKAELVSHLRSNTVNAAWLMSACFRSAAAMSRISLDERNVFQHVIKPESETRMYDFSDQENSVAYWEHFDEIRSLDKISRTENFTFTNLDYSFSLKLRQKLKELFPEELYYPFAGVGKFGIALLIKGYLKNEYLLGLPKKRIKAHGTDLSPLSFLMHDLFHGNIDPRLDELLTWLCTEADSHVANGGDAQVFFDWIPYVVQKYTDLMACFEVIYHEFLTRLLPHYGADEFNKVMVGLFLILHEYPGFNIKTFQSIDLENIIQDLCHQSIETINDEDGWESPEDLFETSPIDGSSSLGLDQTEALVERLKEKALEEVSSSMVFPLDYYSAAPEVQKEFRRNLISTCHLDMNERFIDVKFVLKSGKELQYSYATLYHKWQNMDDAQGLLQLAGIQIEKPTLDESHLKRSRELVQDTLKHVQKEVAGIIRHFKDRAVFFVNYKDREGLSLNDRFRMFHFRQEQSLRENLEQRLQDARLEGREQGLKIKIAPRLHHRALLL